MPLSNSTVSLCTKCTVVVDSGACGGQGGRVWLNAHSALAPRRKRLPCFLKDAPKDPTNPLPPPRFCGLDGKHLGVFAAVLAVSYFVSHRIGPASRYALLLAWTTRDGLLHHLISRVCSLGPCLVSFTTNTDQQLGAVTAFRRSATYIAFLTAACTTVDW